MTIIIIELIFFLYILKIDVTRYILRKYLLIIIIIITIITIIIINE
jgi:hypothetical protein